jgi:SAM-dependent methyltransferase
MDHSDHVALLRAGINGAGTTWADIGAGTGAFTLALADLLRDDARIFAVDRDERALEETARVVADRFPAVTLTTLVGDLLRPLDLPPLDGLVAANSLHFVQAARQVAAVEGLARYLRPGAPFIVVEYDADRGNPWVPHPFSSRRWADIAAAAGLVDTVEIGRVPSRFLGSIYAAVSRRSRAGRAA